MQLYSTLHSSVYSFRSCVPGVLPQLLFLSQRLQMQHARFCCMVPCIAVDHDKSDLISLKVYEEIRFCVPNGEKSVQNSVIANGIQ